MNDKKNELSRLLQQAPLFVFAMQEEAQSEFEGADLLFTGIGKVNAAYGLTKALAKNSYSIIVNLGSAGSYKYKRDQVICCTSFVQRDMDACALGFEPYQTPFSNVPVLLNYGLSDPALTTGTCGSGDNFDTSNKVCCYDVVDMEAYALALVAMREQVPFLCLKYITDGADGAAAQDWQTSLNQAAARLQYTLKQLKL